MSIIGIFLLAAFMSTGKIVVNNSNHGSLLRFSSGFCPSCGGRRMSEEAADLVDNVLPEVPIRQWVLTLTHRIRYLIAFDRVLCSDVRRIFIRVVDLSSGNLAP